MTLAEEHQAEQNHKFKPYLMRAVLISDAIDWLLSFSCCKQTSSLQRDQGSQFRNISGHSPELDRPFWNGVAD